MKSLKDLKKYLVALIVLTFHLVSFAQSDTIRYPENVSRRLWALQTVYQNGYVFATNPFLKGINAEAEKIKAFQAFSVKLSFQTTGKNSWEQLYNFPQYGVGLYVADFYNPEEIGVPIAVYGFFNAPFKRWDKLTFNYEIGFGATFNWRAYNPVTNQYNVAIGAGTSFLMMPGLTWNTH